jgi:hypothetical protein
MADATFTVRLAREDVDAIDTLLREVRALRAQLAGEPIPLPQPTAFERDFGGWMEAHGAVRVDEPATPGCAAPAAASAARR